MTDVATAEHRPGDTGTSPVPVLTDVAPPLPPVVGSAPLPRRRRRPRPPVPTSAHVGGVTGAVLLLVLAAVLAGYLTNTDPERSLVSDPPVTATTAPASLSQPRETSLCISHCDTPAPAPTSAPAPSTAPSTAPAQAPRSTAATTVPEQAPPVERPSPAPPTTGREPLVEVELPDLLPLPAFDPDQPDDTSPVTEPVEPSTTTTATPPATTPGGTPDTSEEDEQ